VDIDVPSAVEVFTTLRYINVHLLTYLLTYLLTPPDPLAVFKGPTSKGKKGKGHRRRLHGGDAERRGEDRGGGKAKTGRAGGEDQKGEGEEGGRGERGEGDGSENLAPTVITKSRRLWEGEEHLHLHFTCGT